MISQEPVWRDDIPEQLQAICSRAIAKNTADRYQNIGDFKKDLLKFLEHRESISISEKSQTALTKVEAYATGGKLSPEKRNQVYSLFIQAIYGFGQAIELWDQNAKAIAGKQTALLTYAKTALYYGDIGLAETQVRELEGLLP